MKNPNMPLYLGFPVTCQEAFRLFRLDFEQVKCDIMQKYRLTEKMFMDGYFVDYANNFFKGKDMAMRVFYTDKGQCIVGYKIENTSSFERKFVKVCDFTKILENLRTQFWHEITIINCETNFNKIVLEHMEDEPETVEGSEPYIVEFRD
jgi:hypothetical protein